MGDCLRTGIPPRYVACQPPRPTQPPTLCETGNHYRPKCGDALRLRSKGRIWLIPFVDKHVHWWQVKLCDPSLTRAILSALDVSCHEKALYKCPVFNFFFFSMDQRRVD